MLAMSTCEVEYYSTTDAAKGGIHLSQIMGEIFNEPISGTTTIMEDNLSAIAYSQNAMVIEMSKDIDMKWHFLKDHVEHGTVILRHLPTDRMVTDMYTKPLLGPALARRQSAIM
jgi:hypothetical protein